MSNPDSMTPLRLAKQIVDHAANVLRTFEIREMSAVLDRGQVAQLDRRDIDLQAELAGNLPGRDRTITRACRAFDRPRQDGVLDVPNSRKAARRGAAPLEPSRGGRPVKQRHVPRVSGAAPLVVNEAVIDRAPRRDQPAARQPRIVDRAGVLKLAPGSAMSSDGLPNNVCSSSRTPSGSPRMDVTMPNGSSFTWARSAPDSTGGCLAAGNRGRPEAHANRAEKSYVMHPVPPLNPLQRNIFTRRHRRARCTIDGMDTT